jgi:hypothetical protein
MILEKGKVYKIKHQRTHFGDDFLRDYILCCPSESVYVDETQLVITYPYLVNITSIECLFLIGFNELFYSDTKTTLFKDCSIEPLNEKDIAEIGKVVYSIGHGYKYNRKLNKIVNV